MTMMIMIAVVIRVIVVFDHGKHSFLEFENHVKLFASVVAVLRMIEVWMLVNKKPNENDVHQYQREIN